MPAEIKHGLCDSGFCSTYWAINTCSPESASSLHRFNVDGIPLIITATSLSIHSFMDAESGAAQCIHACHLCIQNVLRALRSELKTNKVWLNPVSYFQSSHKEKHMTRSANVSLKFFVGSRVSYNDWSSPKQSSASFVQTHLKNKAHFRFRPFAMQREVNSIWCKQLSTTCVDSTSIKITSQQKDSQGTWSLTASPPSSLQLGGPTYITGLSSWGSSAFSYRPTGFC